MNYEYIDQRIFGAFMLVDAATGQHIARPLQIEAATGRVVRNTSNLYVVVAADGFTDYSLSFDTPTTPDLGSIPFSITIRDPQRQYLAQQITLNLPRDPDPANADDAENSIFHPRPVTLFPTPAAPIMANWSVIRAAVTVDGSGEPLSGALVLVIQDDTIIGRGLSDARGEALIAVSGVPVTTWNGDDLDDEDENPGGGRGRGGRRGPGADDDDETPLVLVSEIAVTLQTIVDPAATGLPDPEDLEARRASLPMTEQPLSLAAGRHEGVSITVSIT